MSPDQLGYVGGRLDRADHIRVNPDLAAQALASPDARCLVLDGLDPVTRDGHLLMEPVAPDASLEDHLLLGLDEEQRPASAGGRPGHDRGLARAGLRCGRDFHHVQPKPAAGGVDVPAGRHPVAPCALP